jgi:trimethylamine--corrinoid protein Co-methyltransferase
MPTRPLQLRRPALFRRRDLETIEDSALRILSEIGVEVRHPGLAERARGRGFQFDGHRVRVPRVQVTAFLEEARGEGGERHQAEAPAAGSDDFRLSTSPYPQNTHDPATDEVVPMTSDRLVEATKLVDMAADRGLRRDVPGCPVDVPAALQVLAQYRIGMENLRGWTGPVDPKAVASLPYVMEMAEVMGRPFRGLPVYVFSPLRLAGESLTAVMQYESRLESIWVGSMPTAGMTAPVRPAEAFALAAAEVIGSAMILGACLRPQIHWHVNVFPFDLRGMAITFGSPEALLFEMASCEVDAFLHGGRWWPAAGNIHTMAKRPGPQAAAEKMSIMAIGALLGARDFTGAGALSLDEIHSSVQLLLDLEVKDHVARLQRGLDTGLDREACLSQVQEGTASSFLELDQTLAAYQSHYWHPRLLERRFVDPWRAAGSPRLVEQAAEMARALIAQHDYEPPEEVRREFGRIYRRAEQALAVSTGR